MERWEPVLGYEAGYAVSDQGRVWSFKSARCLAPKRFTDDYWGVGLSRGGECRSFLIHRLVCAAFHGPAPDGKQVAHGDGNKANNAATNLAWVTPKENTAHKIAHGTHQAGERHPRARLTAEQVQAIRAAPVGGQQLAEQFGISAVMARQIRSGTRWK